MPARKRVDYTFSWNVKLPDVDFDALKPKPPPVYGAWHLISQDGGERRSIWAYEDEYGWHGWPMYNGEPDKSVLFTTYPKPSWKKDTDHA